MRKSELAPSKLDIASLAAMRKKISISSVIEPISCPHCGGRADLMRRTLHPTIKGEIWTFECKDCNKQTEKSHLHP